MSIPMVDHTNKGTSLEVHDVTTVTQNNENGNGRIECRCTIYGLKDTLVVKLCGKTGALATQQPLCACH